MHGVAVTTVEGIGSVAKGLHPVQVEKYGILTHLLNIWATRKFIVSFTQIILAARSLESKFTMFLES